jgi:hypothetical protein
MKSKLFLAGVFGVALTFGIVVIGCDNGGGEGGNDGPKTLIITNIDATQAAQGQSGFKIGIFPVGTSATQALAWTGIVAGADSENSGVVTLSGSAPPFTATVLLYALPGGTSRWTGSGTYDVYLVLGNNKYYGKQNVSFTSASTSISAATFTEYL